ncbi:MAG: DUF2752 domain-containing protein [Bacteroidia bacterium]
MISLKSLPLELIIWIASLTFLYFNNPYVEQSSFCILKLLGFSWCPGCGIGHSISLLMHGEFQASFKAHWLGAFAFVVLLQRIVILTKNYFRQYNINPETNLNYGQKSTHDAS